MSERSEISEILFGMSEMLEMMSEMSEVMSEMSEVMSEMISEVGNSEKDGVLPPVWSFFESNRHVSRLGSYLDKMRTESRKMRTPPVTGT